MPYSLFDVFGVELEYMIVDRATLQVRPIADTLIHAFSGDYTSDVDRGPIAWSNELVNHVVELKTNGPAEALDGLAEAFHAEVRVINEALEEHGAMLLPTGAHPLMDPHRETVLWPHEYNEVYSLYDRVFDCRGHGWANLQSVHLNLPFDGDAEFARLHAAIRVLLPIIPALSASTPLLDGTPTGFRDSRLETYRHNQKRLPIIAGAVVPEPVFSEADYHARIFQPVFTRAEYEGRLLQGIYDDLAPLDPEGVLRHEWVNARGCIARFDRGAIEIRIIDLQECPAADLALLQGIVMVLRALVDEAWAPLPEQQRWSEHDLAAIFLDVIRDAEDTRITDGAYLHLFGMETAAATAGEVWQHLLEELGDVLPADARRLLRTIAAEGCLSTRILRRLGAAPAEDVVRSTYRELAECLAANTLLA